MIEKFLFPKEYVLALERIAKNEEADNLFYGFRINPANDKVLNAQYYDVPNILVALGVDDKKLKRKLIGEINETKLQDIFLCKIAL
nr:hypothetical protein [Bacteroidota bacterium]